ncbi:thiamine-phosphate kinase [Permianibacter sp. IMCC34836]|uniref:thiamine-phosphate kinase n=1 Tax=Permianibacter fluminis TaxID=2738515 RepID=UPI0015529B00|nr:thiamine-phosphate kinase [Permianibacter fluminis]NQD36879.1 thiamine-phosphate kinase [Permianibacter fluminis]
MPGEFDLIQRYFTRPNRRDDVALAVGDDCALLTVPAGQLLAVSTDTLIAGVHFPVDTAPYDIGWKALAVNLSDLAAMGAQPAWATLAITLPEFNHPWLQAFSAGLFALAEPHKLALVGGDTTRGPLSITITVHGFVPAPQALRRDAAQVGDVVAVTGTLGDAGRALAHALGQSPITDQTDAEWLLARLNRPSPRLAAALALRGIGHAAIDISDGLLQDLQHVLNRSGVGAALQMESLPLSAALRRQTTTEQQAVELALGSGDDYELCVTIPAARWPQAQAAVNACGVTLTRIGRITATPGLALDWNGAAFMPTQRGYDHFKDSQSHVDQANSNQLNSHLKERS